MKNKNLVKRILLVVLGHIITGLGIGVFLYSSLGVDPGSVLHSGVSSFFNISYGRASAINNIIILVVVFFIDRSYINIASFLGIIFIGYSADLSKYLLGLAVSPKLSLLASIVLVILGCLIMGLGIALYTSAKLGVGAIDVVSEVISDKSQLEFRKVRVLSDLAYVLVGYLLGGSVGIATLISAILIGPSIQMFRSLVTS